MNKHEEVKDLVKLIDNVLEKTYNKRGDFSGFLNLQITKVITLSDIKNTFNDYITQFESIEKELALYKEFVKEFNFSIEHDSFDEDDISKDCEYLDIGGATDKSIELFKQIKNSKQEES